MLFGFFAASLGLRIDVENPRTRLLMIFAFTLLNRVYLFIMHRMLAFDVTTSWVDGGIKAVINSLWGWCSSRCWIGSGYGIEAICANGQ